MLRSSSRLQRSVIRSQSWPISRSSFISEALLSQRRFFTPTFNGLSRGQHRSSRSRSLLATTRSHKWRRRSEKKTLSGGDIGSLRCSQDFKNSVIDNLKNLRSVLLLQDEFLPYPLNQPENFGPLYSKFSTMVCRILAGKPVREAHTKDDEKMMGTLVSQYHFGGSEGVLAELKNTFYANINRFSERSQQNTILDFRYPAEWFPATRAIKREIHLHVGPTNSGKTYHALQRLEKAESGIYAGPLRLLAHEIYTRLNAKGLTCDLVTGEERRIEGDGPAPRQSCTVEMVPMNLDVDVAVIDEIQMMGDIERGWAWTQAFLGVKAKEVHACGEERVIPLIKQLAASTGDNLHIHHYERLNPLKVMYQTIDSFSKLQKGDAIVSFSKMNIHALRKAVEQHTGRRVAIVYGSLPPETRALQADLFNDPNNDYDFLIASNAIGMGLNLKIKRLIFETLRRYNGERHVTIDTPDIKQIAGRAGRYVSPQDKVNDATNRVHGSNWTQSTQSPGLVTCFDRADLKIVRKALEEEPEPLKTAGLLPPASVICSFAANFPPETKFSHIVAQLHSMILKNPRIHLCSLASLTRICDCIESVKGLTAVDRYIFACSPAGSFRDDRMKKVLQAYARCIGDSKSGHLLDIEDLHLEVLDRKISPDKDYLVRLEELHQSLILYLWLSWRFKGVFVSRALAMHVKEITEQRIDEVLTNFSYSSKVNRRLAMLRELKRSAHEEDEQIVEVIGARRASTNSPATGITMPLSFDTSEANAEASMS